MLGEEAVFQWLFQSVSNHQLDSDLLEKVQSNTFTLNMKLEAYVALSSVGY